MRDAVAEIGFDIPQFVQPRPRHRTDWSDEAVDARKAEARKRKAEPPARHNPVVMAVRHLDYVTADSLPTEDRAFDDELIEGVIGKACMAVLYGDSNSGKTFMVIDIAVNVAAGLQWMGRNTAAGMVIYLATEAVASVQLRAAAWQRQHGVKLPGLVIVQSPVNLFDGAADVHAVIELVGELETRLGEKCLLIVADTLARIAAGANENSGEDMALVLRNADIIREATQATFLWVHHTGKDAAKGMRGWSGMRAAIDTEIEVSADDATGQRVAEITKQRDLPGKGERIGFRLDVVSMGFNRWGTERTTCVVVPADAPPKPGKHKRMGEVEGAVIEFLISRRVGVKKAEVAKHFDGRHLRTSVYRAIDALVKAGAAHAAAGMVVAAEAAK